MAVAMVASTLIVFNKRVEIMEKIAVIFNSKIVNNYDDGGKRPYCWLFTLNYLLDEVVSEVEVRYEGEVIYSVGNVVLFDIDNNKVDDIDNLSDEYIYELEVIRDFYGDLYNKVNSNLNVSDFKIDTIEEKLSKHNLRVDASFEVDKLSRLLENLNNDIFSKKTRKLK